MSQIMRSGTAHLKSSQQNAPLAVNHFATSADKPLRHGRRVALVDWGETLIGEKLLKCAETADTRPR